LITAKVIKLCSMFYDMDPEETMKIMESLMVKGLITYHRTDSYNLSDEAVESIREYLQDHGLPIPPYPTKHKRKKGISQEAHEAIRPTDIYNDSPEELSEDELKVYSLIHRQTLASQMADAHRKITRANFVGDNGFKFVVRGVEYISLSFLELLPELANDHKPKFVPDLYEGECLYPTGKKTIAARTEQPKRYSIATMVEDMDTEGIGRPSTYATVFSSLIKREYIVKEKTILRPTKLGMTVCYSLVDTHFSNSEYTARTEEKFDFLSSGEMSYSDVIKPIASEILDDVKRVSVDMKNVHISIKTCSKCGKIMKKRKGKNGFFWGCTGFPDCKNAESI
ncbi:MAG: topoisomerase DNA-binding C4 zinc finger domain-containing protein, partial [Proteobacteria bacterium]|nr:topoisomerase DNA-binding C4 zinc finger domain-containing protein [Pseudomonadota bacterium]